MKGRPKRTRHLIFALPALFIGVHLGAYTTHAQETAEQEEAIVETAVEEQIVQEEAVVELLEFDAEADRIMREMGEYLASAQAFTFRAVVSYDVMLSHGQMVQLGGTSDVTVRRPGQVRALYNGDERRTRTYLDNGALVIHNDNKDIYAATEVPTGIDEAIDFIFDRLGITVPIADLLYADPYATLMEHVQSGYVVGDHTIDGTPCKHLALSQDSIDWEIWISSDGKPLPMKVVIRYKSEQGSPQYTAILSGWDVNPEFPADHFEFTPPEGVELIEFLPSPETEDQP